MADETLISGAQDDTETPESEASDTPSGEEVKVEADADADATEEDTDDKKASEEPADADKTDKDGDKDEDVKGEGAPEEYETFTLPEGMELDDKVLEAATPLFKELGLNQGAAQKVVDLYNDLQAQQSNALAESWANTQEEWVKGINEHKEFGGAGLEGNLAHIGRAIDTVFGKAPTRPEEGAKEEAITAFNAHPNTQFREALAITGAGNHPRLFEFMVKVGKSMSEDGISTGGGFGGDKPAPDLAERFYGSDAKD